MAYGITCVSKLTVSLVLSGHPVHFFSLYEFRNCVTDDQDGYIMKGLYDVFMLVLLSLNFKPSLLPAGLLCLFYIALLQKYGKNHMAEMNLELILHLYDRNMI